MATLYQRSTIGALLAGVFDGTETVGELLRHGDFGLGTFNALDGELVVFDGIAYQVTSDGRASLVPRGKRTPFAAVTQFVAEHTLELQRALRREDAATLIHAAARSENITMAVRITGHFRHILMRTVAAQTRPYPQLDEATRNEVEVTVSDVRGTLIGFRTPEFEHSIGVAGYHLHFLSDDRETGGHMLDFTLASGEIALMEITDIHLSLPTSGAFLTADLDPVGGDDKIRAAEGS
ncbi:MAG TPA: acetolactate decarboxylase [Galbitalea sp.]|jgi:acetolactate decarboxylase|nr:acetolactate decarboxylase [Galbitalea sp.]